MWWAAASSAYESAPTSVTRPPKPTLHGRRTPPDIARHRPGSQWHLDEMAVQIAGKRFWLWRAVDHEGEVLDILMQRRRNKAAALKLMRKLLKKQGFAPVVLVTD